METRNSSINITRRRVLGAIFLTIFSLAFIFSCMQKILPIGRAIVGTFGVLTYPMLLLLMLISLAGFLGFSYTRNIKSTSYFCVAFVSILLFVQAISTFSDLNKVIGWKSLANYLKICYTTKITFVGSCGSLVCGIISILLGAMGSIVIFVIMATLFIGLFIDYQFYGKYEQPHVKKLKTRKIREKVQKSDKKKTSDSSPIYSFNGHDENEVLSEITINENEISSTGSIYEQPPIYSSSDVVGEITNAEISSGYTEYDDMGQISQPYQTQNSFTSDFYQEQSYPGIYSGDSDEKRRQFMRDTYGGNYGLSSQENTQNDYQTNQYASSSFGESYAESNNSQKEEPSSFDSFANDVFAGLEVNNLGEDDEISKILNSREEEIETDVKQDYSSEPISNSGFNFNFGETKTPEPSTESQFGRFGGFEQRKPEPEPVSRFSEPTRSASDRFERFGQQPPIQQPVQNLSNGFGAQNVAVTPKPITSPYNVPISMPGVRYNVPPLSLLKAPKPDNGDYTEEQNRKSAQLEKVLEAFGVPAKVQNIVRGPKITRFELSVPLGVSVKRIPNYETDIAAALAAKTIVIKAPIPGSPYVGIELENDTFTSVYERELLESPEFQNFKDPLPVAIGKDISGEIVVKSLAKMVHLLIAGSTGSGKSVFMHNIILSLLYKSSPDDLKLIMIDPKKVEFNRYNGIPHLLTPEVVSGSEKAINAFKWCVKEMERRYDLMSKAGYNNIEPYNKSELVKAGQFEKFPYIVIVVDELAEIMAVNKKDVELCIQRLTQLARACGMHLVVATQRPSVDIITGVIKNNIPSRIAFSLQSGIDSKTILNAVGAEKLLGQGDMIFAPTGTSATPRLQAAYASDDEIKNVIDYVKKNNVSNYDETVNNIINAEQPETTEEVATGGFMDAPQPKDLDPYFKTALKLVMGNNGASVSYLQRRLQIGYSRAARIIDQMEDKNYIAPSTGAKLRKVLITPEQFREEFGEDCDSLND